MAIQDINGMTAQQIVDFMRQNGFSKREINQAIGQSIENFYEKHDIDIRCPECGSVNKVRNGTNSSGLIRYKCKDCGKGYSPTTNTIFEGMNYTVDEMIYVVHSVLTQDSIPEIAYNLKDDNEVSYSVVWLLVHKILRIISQLRQPKLSGVIQIDEKYFRETQKGSRKLVSMLNTKESRNARKHHNASKCGIFGPEFVNVLCAVDNEDRYWARCVRLGPLELEDLEDIHDFWNVAYICTDNLGIYSDWCDSKGYKHYIEPSTYRKERKARGYIQTDDIYRNLTEEEYKLDEKINRQLYKEGLYPHIENMDHKLSFDEFMDIKRVHGLGLHRVNGFHSLLENFLQNTRGVSTEYLEDWIALFVFMMNYKKSHNINSFSKKDAENILVMMIKHTLKTKSVPTREDIENQDFLHYKRPSQRAITNAKKKMKVSRDIIVEPAQYDGDGRAYEGEDELSQNLFNKRKFFTSLGTVRINELCKLYHIYDRKDNKPTKVDKLCALDNADDIIFHEIYVRKYGSVNDMKKAFEQLPEKRKRGRPRKNPTT